MDGGAAEQALNITMVVSFSPLATEPKSRDEMHVTH